MKLNLLRKFSLRLLSNYITAASVIILLTACQKSTTNELAQRAEDKRILRALIIDGQNNHGIWPKTTVMMKRYLEETGLFEVDVERTQFTYQGPHNDNDDGNSEAKRMQLLETYPIEGMKNTTMVPEPKHDPDYIPDFSKYNVVISNFGWKTAPWPETTKTALEKFVNNGGGLVIIHAANNAFPEWVQYNKMIGMGAWGDRTEKDGPYVYYNNNNELVRDTSPGGAGSHGRQLEFLITMRDTLHPITKGIPVQWLHAKDEMYDRLRGPAENMEILATAYSDEEQNASHFSPLRGTNRHEPMMMTVTYGEGRIYHTPMGHADYSMECVGFIVTFQRGTEWAATGKVTNSKIPNDFPDANKVSQRTWNDEK